LRIPNIVRRSAQLDRRSVSAFNDACDAGSMGFPTSSARDQDDVFDGSDVGHAVVSPYPSDHAAIPHDEGAIAAALADPGVVDYVAQIAAAASVIIARAPPALADIITQEKLERRRNGLAASRPAQSRAFNLAFLPNVGVFDRGRVQGDRKDKYRLHECRYALQRAPSLSGKYP
jgi:hypothetical protein